MSVEWEVITRLTVRQDCHSPSCTLPPLHTFSDALPAYASLRGRPFCIVATWSLTEETESKLTADGFVVNYPKPTHPQCFG